MTYDVILLSPDNLNGSEEEIIDLPKKNGKTHIPRLKLNPKQVDQITHFGLVSMEYYSRVGFYLNTSFHVTKKMFRHPIHVIVTDFVFCATGSVKLELSAK